MSTIHFPHIPHRIRPAQFSGTCYPSSTKDLAALLNNVLYGAPHLTPSSIPVRQGAKAIIAPHIDYRIGLSAYAPAYFALENSNADVIVIFATSHYAWGNLFIPTFQHFATPLGTVQTDYELLRALQEYAGRAFTLDDKAHHEEHSIEFEVVFLQHLFGHRAFTIVPILVTSFYPFIQQGVSPRASASSDTFQRFTEALRTAIQKSGKNAAFVASADMAHIGRKFGDPFDAAPMLQATKEEDMRLLEALVRADSEDYFWRIARLDDSYKICGLPPVYSMLETVHCSDGEVFVYEQWNEVATQSAVTYSSLGYYETAL